MILGHNEIHNRIAKGEVFRRGTWHPGCLREASYVLRIAADGLLLDGKFYDPVIQERRDEFPRLSKKVGGTTVQEPTVPERYIKIDPGKIAILSTIEELNMPADLVGKIGIRLKFAQLGLTGLMGIQVDPHFGHEKNHERLFIRVANFGNEAITLSEGDGVFTFELHEVKGHVPLPAEPRKGSWSRIRRTLKDLDDASWSYVTRVESNLSAETQSVKDYFQPLVMFGVFLVAVSILATAIAVLVQTPAPPKEATASWLDVDKQDLLLWVLLVGVLGTTWVGLAAGWRFLRPYRRGTPRANAGLIRTYWKRFWHRLW